MFSLVSLAAAWALSAGIVHVIERPVPPFKGMNHQQLEDRAALYSLPDREPIVDPASAPEAVTASGGRSSMASTGRD